MSAASYQAVGFCPTCGICIALVELNCAIIRCGAVVLSDGRLEQFPPHASAEVVTALLEKPHIGCGAPLKFENGIFKLGTYDS